MEPFNGADTIAGGHLFVSIYIMIKGDTAMSNIVLAIGVIAVMLLLYYVYILMKGDDQK